MFVVEGRIVQVTEPLELEGWSKYQTVGLAKSIDYDDREAVLGPIPKCNEGAELEMLAQEYS